MTKMRLDWHFFYRLDIKNMFRIAKKISKKNNKFLLFIIVDMIYFN